LILGETEMTSATQSPASLSPGWSLALGILLVIAGVLALVFPVIAAVTAALYIGWFAIIAGVIAIVIAIRTRTEPQSASSMRYWAFFWSPTRSPPPRRLRSWSAD